MTLGIKKVISVIVAVSIAAVLLGGCSSSNKQQAVKEKQQVTAEEKKAASSGPETITLPIVKEPVKMKFFWQMDGKATMVIKSYSEMGFFKEMEKRTGIQIEFIHPAASQAEQQFNLMLASKDLPEMVWYSWSKVPGGVQKLVEKGTIVKLNEYLDKYSPNMKKALEQHPDWKKQITLDDGTFYKYPKIKTDPTLLVTSGFQIRKDWLDRLGLKEPATIDEWHTVLKAFKEKDANGNGDPNDEIPFASSDKDKVLHNFGVAWKVVRDFYNDGGKIKFGPIEPAYKDFLVEMAKWYKEGLIDPDYLSADATNFESKVVSNKAGAYYGMCNGHMGKFLGLWEKDHPDYKLVGVWPPKASDGKKYCREFQSDVSDDGLAFTSSNKYVRESVKWADYVYGDEGNILCNYGIEGASYKMVNGKPKFTDEILKNPQGFPVINALHKYTYSVSTGAGYQLKDVFSQAATYPSQNEAYDRWTQDVVKINLTSLNPTEDEGKKLSKTMGDVQTYVNEMFNKFIMGQESLDKFDNYVKTVKGMGAEEAVKIQQTMLDRYNAKK